MEENKQTTGTPMNDEPVLCVGILQSIIDFAEKRYFDSAETYLDTYRASRQASKEIRDFVKKVANKEGIKLKTKKLECRYD